jgi:SNF2 family DNA or RNA helicase
MNFSSREEEFAQHHADLRQAKEAILQQFPDKIVKLYFAELDQAPDVFNIKPVE